MAPLIRAATLSRESHKLARRPTASAPAAEPPRDPVAVLAPQRTEADKADAFHTRQQHAEQQLAAEREQEKKAGYALGYSQGLAEAQASYRDKHQRLDQLITSAGQSFSSQIDGLEDIAVSIAFESLVKILGEKLVTRQGVQAVVEKVLTLSHEREKLSVRLAPSDFYLLLQQSAEAPWRAAAGVELVPDDRIELGGCLVDTGGGSLDGRLETQMDVLRQLMLQTRAQRKAGGEAG